MNKAFNFIETVLALLVGLVILAGLLRFVNVGTSQYLEAKKQLQWEANASMARTALRSRFRQLDPQFWANFPAMRDPIHGAFTFLGQVVRFQLIVFCAIKPASPFGIVNPLNVQFRLLSMTLPIPNGWK